MNAERLHAIARAINQEIKKSNLVNNLQELADSLQNVVNDPDSEHQKALGNALQQVLSALTNVPSDDFSPAWRQILEELGGDDILGRSLKAYLQDVFERNQITPSVALQDVQQVHKLVRDFDNALTQVINGAKYLKIGAEELEPGECELGVLVPRQAVHNRLGYFAKELSELNFIFGTLSELSSGERENFEIRTISSSDLIIYLKAIPVVAACVAHVAEKIITLYKQFLEIRKLKKELREQGVPEDKMQGIEDHANTMMAKGIETLTVEVVKEYYKGNDKGRKNELKNAVRISLNKIANRIDQGFNIEVRTEPLPEPDEGQNDSDTSSTERYHVNVVLNASKTMQFMKLEGDSILHLSEGDEGTKKVDKKKH